MAKTKGELEITVRRTWPLHNLKTVQIKLNNGSIIHDDVTLTREEAEEVYVALRDILGKNSLKKEYIS